MGMRVAYWHKDGLEVYRFIDKKTLLESYGSLDELKPIRRVFGKKVLIVGRELILHTKKRYPPAPVKKLIKAVELEIKDIFPISKPAFYCQVDESSAAFTTLDIWAWDSEPYGRIRGIFPFHFVLPEDLVFSSEVSEIKIFQYRGMTHMLAHSGHRFLGGTSSPEGGIDEKSMERFLSGLGRDRPEIKQIKVYGDLSFRLKEGEIPNISRVTQGDYPICMDHLAALNLGPFEVKEEFRLAPKIDFLCRVAIYMILGYGLMLHLTTKNYDQKAIEIRQKINAIDTKIFPKGTEQKVEDYSGVIKEVNDKLFTRRSPLKVMDTVAQNLPMGSFITRMALNENNLEVYVSSRDPLSVIKALGGAEGIKTVQLKGSPGKDVVSGSYNFIVLIEL